MIFRYHYALWWGGLTNIIPIVSEFIKLYFESSSRQTSIFYILLPVTLVIIKPFVCALADSYRAHHHCLLLFQILTLLGFGSTVIFPYNPQLYTDYPELSYTIFCIAMFIGSTSMSIVNSIVDSLAIHAANEQQGHHYSRYRLWGPMGVAFFGILWTQVDKIPMMPKFAPGIFVFAILHTINILYIVSKYDRQELRLPHWHFNFHFHNHHKDQSQCITIHNNSNNKNHDNFNKNEIRNSPLTDAKRFEMIHEKNYHQDVPSWKIKDRVHMAFNERLFYLRKMTRHHWDFFLYIMVFMYCGLMTGVQLQLFRVLATLDTKSVPNLIMLFIFIQSFFGEIIFFLVAEPIINYLGTKLTLTISLLSYGFKHLVYSRYLPQVTNFDDFKYLIWIELLQGPAFGLMYCVMTHKAHEYSVAIDKYINRDYKSQSMIRMNIMHATLQGLISSSYDGLGMGLGAILGYKIYQYDHFMIWSISALGAFTLAFIVFLITLMKITSELIMNR